MAEYVIPQNAGPYKIITSRAGSPLVTNDYTGKRHVRIPCKSWEQAEDICRRLNEDDHQGFIRA